MGGVKYCKILLDSRAFTRKEMMDIWIKLLWSAVGAIGYHALGVLFLFDEIY